MTEDTKLSDKFVEVLKRLGFVKPAAFDNRPKVQRPIAVARGMGEIHRTVRAYKHGALAARPHSFIGSLIEKAVAKVARDAWLQGKEAHEDCENPYKT